MSKFKEIKERIKQIKIKYLMAMIAQTFSALMYITLFFIGMSSVLNDVGFFDVFLNLNEYPTINIFVAVLVAFVNIIIVGINIEEYKKEKRHIEENNSTYRESSKQFIDRLSRDKEEYIEENRLHKQALHEFYRREDNKRNRVTHRGH